MRNFRWVYGYGVANREEDYGPEARDVPLLEPAVARPPGAVNTKREDDAPSHDVILCRETTSPCRTRSAVLERPDDMP